MRLRDLKDVYRGQDIYIVGSGPTAGIFPMEFFKDKICMALNSTYKLNPVLKPITFMHHEFYSREGDNFLAKFHPYFYNIKYPIAKATGKTKLELIDFSNPHFYFFEHSTEIEKIWTQNKETDILYYYPNGCSLHGALQVCWIMGARNIYIIGCDSRVMDGRHYADFEKNGFRDNDSEAAAQKRSYDAYVYGTLILQEFLRRKSINVFNLSTIIGLHRIEEQYSFWRGNIEKNIDDLVHRAKKTVNEKQ